MSRHQARLLLCSAAAVALIVGATLVLEWFRIDFNGMRMTIGLHGGTICTADGSCTPASLRGLGAYRVLAEGAFWNALLLALLVLAQSGMSVFTGAASALASRIGYIIGSITLLCAFGAGFLFAPDPPAELSVMGLDVARTFAPVMLVVGSLLGILAVRYAQLEEVSDGAAEYKPVFVPKDPDNVRLPVTPLSVNRVPYPGDAEPSSPARARASSESGLRARRPSEPGTHARAPSEPGVRARASSESGIRTRTPSQQVERIPLPGNRTKSPSQPGERTPASEQSMRSRSPSQQIERIALPGDRTKSPSQPGERTPASEQSVRSRSPSQQIERIALPGDRSKSPSQPGDAGASGDRSRSPSQQSLDARTKSGSQQPLDPRTRSGSQPPLVARTKSPSQQPFDDLDMPSRARTSSSGPIDLAARLSGAPIAVAIKPPLPEPIPVPPDQIPVAPESGLVIRKRTPSAGPLLAHQLPAASAQSLASSMSPPGSPPPLAGSMSPPPSAHTGDEIPVSPESGLVIRKKPSQPDLRSPVMPPQAFGSAESPRGASGITPPGAMPSIALRHVDPDIDNPFASPAKPQLPAKHEDVLAQLPAKHDDSATGLAVGRTPTPGEPAVTRAFTPPDKPAALRGKLKYAVNMATLTSMGITAHREDGTMKHVGWDDIIGIIARRLPAEAPYDGATFVDLVSMSGSTLRILPWTRLDGAPVRGDGEERARGVVQLIAARCLEAKLDSWTKVFADGAGHAAQLPSTKTLAAHDDKLA